MRKIEEKANSATDEVIKATLSSDTFVTALRTALLHHAKTFIFSGCTTIAVPLSELAGVTGLAITSEIILPTIGAYFLGVIFWSSCDKIKSSFKCAGTGMVNGVKCLLFTQKTYNPEFDDCEDKKYNPEFDECDEKVEEKAEHVEMPKSPSASAA